MEDKLFEANKEMYLKILKEVGTFEGKLLPTFADISQKTLIQKCFVGESIRNLAGLGMIQLIRKSGCYFCILTSKGEKVLQEELGIKANRSTSEY